MTSIVQPSFWMGPDWREAQRVFEMCLRAGMSAARALMLAQVSSYRDGWVFSSTVARKTGHSVRTFFRALAQGKSLGFLRTARGAKTETPPGAGGPLPCGFSHRWFMGRGLPIEQRAPEQAIASTRWWQGVKQRQVKPLELLALHERKPVARRPPAGVSTLEWLEAQLRGSTKEPQGP